MALTKILDHQAQAFARLAEQYKGSVSFTGLVAIATAEHQTLEQVLWDQFVETVDSAAGASLDVMGKVVGQPREGRDDATYRVWVKARVKVNRSGGTGADLVSIFTALCPGLTVRLEEHYPAAFVLRLSGLAVTNAGVLGSILRLTKAGGVRAVLETTNDLPVTTFTLDTGPGLDVGKLADAQE